jgi:hypothetical protein
MTSLAFATGVVDEIPGCYGEIHSATDFYGDFVLVSEREES